MITSRKHRSMLNFGQGDEVALAHDPGMPTPTLRLGAVGR